MSSKDREEGEGEEGGGGEGEQLLLSKGARYRSLHRGTMKVTLPRISVVLAARFATIGDIWVILLPPSFPFALPLPFYIISH